MGTAPTAIDLANEADALLGYAARCGLLTGETPADTEIIRADIVIPLQRAILAVRGGAADETSQVTLLLLVSALRRRTGEITGRSVLDSPHANALTRGLHRFAVGAALVAVFFLTITVAQPSTSSKGWSLFLALATTAAWGAFGSVTYLLKRLHDLTQTQAFEAQQFQGPFTRVLLGAALGSAFYIVVVDEPAKPFPLDMAAIAFLVGLSVKVFYGVLENTVEAISERFNLSIPKRLAGLPPDTRVATAPNPNQAAAPAAGASTASPAALAWAGNHTAWIVELQQLLMGLGRYPGPAHGVPDAEMVEAAASALRIDPMEQLFVLPVAEVLDRLRKLGAPPATDQQDGLNPDEQTVMDALVAMQNPSQVYEPKRPALISLLRDLEPEIRKQFGDAGIAEMAEQIRKGA